MLMELADEFNVHVHNQLFILVTGMIVELQQFDNNGEF